MGMTRQDAETVFARYLLGEKTQDGKLEKAIAIAIKDMHKMAEIESIVR